MHHTDECNIHIKQSRTNQPRADQENNNTRAEPEKLAALGGAHPDRVIFRRWYEHISESDAGRCSLAGLVFSTAHILAKKFVVADMSISVGAVFGNVDKSN
jgi:hypothetical protein